MYEVAVPLQLQQGEAGGWTRGLGDMAAAMKYTVAHSLARGHILSVGGEMKFPTGKKTRGLGTGVTVVEPFLAFGQMIGADGFVQVHSGVELSTNREAIPHETYVRTTIGRSFGEERGLGRMWTPMLEVLGARELTTGEPMLWDLVPEMQVTLSRRHHVRINAGLRFPVIARAGRSKTFLTYLLWDWFDGGLFDGWR